MNDRHLLLLLPWELHTPHRTDPMPPRGAGLNVCGGSGLGLRIEDSQSFFFGDRAIP